MLYFILTISLLHLAWMNLLAYRKSDIMLCLFSAVAPMATWCMMIASGVLILQVLAMGILVVLCRSLAPDRPSVFLGTSTGAVVIIFGGFTLNMLSIECDLLNRYPMESMAERVPEPRSSKALGVVQEDNAWSVFENQLEEMGREFRYDSRSNQLRRLHEETTDNFVNSDGFGITRMPRGVLRQEGYDVHIRHARPIEQPQASELPISTETLEKPYVARDVEVFKLLHFDGLADFVNIQGFGYIKDRQHVAGFRSHAFSAIPERSGYRVQRVDLVSLLMHDKPAVYISTELPRMQDLKGAPTRGLSGFEAKGLEAIQQGEDQFVRETPEGWLMLGAIRSVAQCVKCHGGERGDLLGAFSYSLQRTSSAE